MPYCPYSDTIFDAADATPDHIIPLSLGGADEFTIAVPREINSRLGHTVDAALARDRVIEMRRARQDVRGHSNSPVQARWKKTRDAHGNPLQGVVDRDGFKLFDPKLRRFLADDEQAGRTVTARWEMDPFVRVPFAAKVALGTGYYLFGDLFRTKVAHAELRLLLTPLPQIPDDELKKNQVSYFDPINDPESSRADPRHGPLESFLGRVDGSAVIVTFGVRVMVFTIGILGRWEATIVVPAQVPAFPATGDYDLGHVLVLKGGAMRSSLREALDRSGVPWAHPSGPS